MPIIPQTLNINISRTTSAKSIKLQTIRKLIKYSLKNLCKGNVYSIVFEILLFKGKLVLSLFQQGTGSEMVKVLVKNQKHIRTLKLLEKSLTFKLRKFWMVSKFFWFCLTLSVPEKLKNPIFEMPIIPQTLNINNLTITIAKSIKLHTIRTLIKYSLKTFVKAMFTFIVFQILLYKCRSKLSPAQRVKNNIVLRKRKII